MVSLIGVAIVTFIITNIDDLLILSVYFGNARYRIRNVVFGQYLGISILVLISLSGLILGSVLENHWISLLGILPIILGTKDLLSGDSSMSSDFNAQSARTKFQWVNVALVTIANGGDNIGVYMPLFANVSFREIPIFIITFLSLTGVWCGLAFYLTRHPFVKSIFGRYGKWILPYFLILLGLYIMSDFFIWIGSKI